MPASNMRAYHVQGGSWLREHRGSYRLALFPEPERPDLILCWFWPRDRSDQPSGVYSYQTAVNLYELKDVNPSQLDMTVPLSFRRGVPVPRILRLHYGDVPVAEQAILSQVPVTGVLRTTLDVWKEGLFSKDALRQAFQRARAGKLPGSGPRKY